MCKRFKDKRGDKFIFMNPKEIYWDILDDLRIIEKDELKVFYIKFVISRLKEIWNKYEALNKKPRKSKIKKEPENDVLVNNLERFSRLIIDVEDLLEDYTNNKIEKRSIATKAGSEYSEIFPQREKIIWTGKKQDFAAIVNFLEEGNYIENQRNNNQIYSQTFEFRDGDAIKQSTAKQIRDLKSKVKCPYSMIKTDENLANFIAKKKAERSAQKSRTKVE